MSLVIWSQSYVCSIHCYWILKMYTKSKTWHILVLRLKRKILYVCKCAYMYVPTEMMVDNHVNNFIIFLRENYIITFRVVFFYFGCNYCVTRDGHTKYKNCVWHTVVPILARLVKGRNTYAWAANIANEWLPCTNILWENFSVPYL